MNDNYNCDQYGQTIPKTTAELCADFKEKLKLAHDALDAFAEKRLADTEVTRELYRCRTTVEAVLRFGISGNLHDPKLDPAKVPMWGFVTSLSEPDHASEPEEL